MHSQIKTIPFIIRLPWPSLIMTLNKPHIYLDKPYIYLNMQALCLPLASLICASPRCFFTLSTASLTEIGDVNFPILPIPYPDLGIYKHTGIQFYMRHKNVIFSFIEWYSWIFKIACTEWLVFYNLRNSEFSLFHQNLKFMKILYLNIIIYSYEF